MQKGENFYKNLELVNAIQSIADNKGITASQLALAWVLAQGDDIIPIPGTKKRKYLQENAAAVDINLTQRYSDSGFYAYVLGKSYTNSGQGIFTLPSLNKWGTMIYGENFKILVGNSESQGNINADDFSDNKFTINSTPL